MTLIPKKSIGKNINRKPVRGSMAQVLENMLTIFQNKTQKEIYVFQRFEISLYIQNGIINIEKDPQNYTDVEKIYSILLHVIRCNSAEKKKKNWVLIKIRNYFTNILEDLQMVRKEQVEK
ncbi:hypothetical protein HZS_1253 [Henneguya salminicola]|nr:hypothetical protein HZS_1253 [Henneguya salminicola]